MTGRYGLILEIVILDLGKVARVKAKKVLTGSLNTATKVKLMG